MNITEATQHALGYAAGREDASDIKTAESGPRAGFIAFADAYANGWDRYNREVMCFMTNARDAYDAWQASDGRSIYQLATMSGYSLGRLADDGDEAATAELTKRTVAV